MIRILRFKGIECRNKRDIRDVFEKNLCSEEEYAMALKQFEGIGVGSIFGQVAELAYEEFSPYLFTNRNVSKTNNK